MKIIGLTGGIASGKSTVSRILREECGANIIDADEVARDVVTVGSELLVKIAEAFGKEVINIDGSLNRQALGTIVFGNTEKRKQLDCLMHPAIRQAILDKLAEYKAQQVSVVFLDVPLLFEAGWDKLTDEVWVVYVDEQIQQSRLMQRNRFTAEQARQRINSQLSLREKSNRADFLIDNCRDMSYTKKQVLNRWKIIYNDIEMADELTGERISNSRETE